MTQSKLPIKYIQLFYMYAACVMVSGHSPLSRPVAWRQSSSPVGLGYRCYASTHPLNALQMAALRAAI